MQLKEIKALINFLANSGLSEVNIETEGIKVAIKKTLPSTISAETPGTDTLSSLLPATTLSVPSAPTADSQAAEENYVTIKSPMIGTFYRSSSPEAPPFVQKGDTVAQGQTVCMIEAMKLFNEIEADISGTVVKVLVENATPVEYDQPLFLINPT